MAYFQLPTIHPLVNIANFSFPSLTTTSTFPLSVLDIATSNSDNQHIRIYWPFFSSLEITTNSIRHHSSPRDTTQSWQ